MKDDALLRMDLHFGMNLKSSLQNVSLLWPKHLCAYFAAYQTTANINVWHSDPLCICKDNNLVNEDPSAQLPCISDVISLCWDSKLVNKLLNRWHMQ